MPSFLRRLSALTGKSSPSSTKSPESGKGRRSMLVDRNGEKKKETATAMAEELNRYSTSGHYSDVSTSSSSSSHSSRSAEPTLSSASSLSLPPSLLDFSPLNLSSFEPSRRQGSEASSENQHFSNPAAAIASSVADRRSKSSGDPGSNSLLNRPPGSLPNSQHRLNTGGAHVNVSPNANANAGDSNNTHKSSPSLQSSSLEPNQNFQPQLQHQHQQRNQKVDETVRLPLSPTPAGSSSTASNSNINISKSSRHASLPIPFPTMSPAFSSSNTQPQKQPQQGQLDPGTEKKMKRGSLNSLTVLFHQKSRSMPMLQDLPTSQTHYFTGVLPQQQPFPPSSTSLSPVLISAALPRGSSKGKNSNHLKRTSLDSSLLMSASQTPEDKKSRPKSLSNMLLQNEQQFTTFPLSSIHSSSSSSSSSQQQSKSGRWAARGGIGAKNEMMVDLETSGVFVPSNGKRLRAEFVYRAVIQCADEIRRRGLGHPNIFLNPSPKKVISAMISLMTDQERSGLYTTECLRIDTVASLMLNLLSQMSNPVVPYAIMEHYFQQGNVQPATKRVSMAPPPMPPLSGRSNTSSGARSTSSPPLSSYDTLGVSLPVIPALSVLNGGQSSPRAPSSSILSWSREHFDLQMFLEALPAMNRVILLEVLHLCAEVLQHQMFNRLTLNRLVQQVAPALFSTVFDQRILEQVAGGSRRCSIHSDRISAEEGTRAENHLFTVILVRFLHITAASQNQTSDIGGKVLSDLEQCASPMSEWTPSASAVSVLPTAVYGTSGSQSQFRKSQELLQLEQQEHYQKMAQSFQEMEIQQDPRLQQHFGQYSASQKQQQQQLQQQLQQKQQSKKQHSSVPGSRATTPSDFNVNNLVIKSSFAVSDKAGGRGRRGESESGGGSGSGSRSPEPNPSQILLPQPIQDSVQAHRDHFWRSTEVRVGAGVAH